MVINGDIKMDEKTYRAIPVDSYSSFKDFLEDRKKYYKKYVLGEKIKEDDDKVMTMGNLVDCMYTNEGDISEKFQLATAPVPKPQYENFVGKLIKRVQEDPEREMVDNIALAREDAAMKKDSLEKVILNFTGTSIEEYFKERYAAEALGKILISVEDLQNAEKIHDELLTNPFTSKIMRQKTNEKVIVIRQHPVFFEINGYPVKGLIDRLEINLEEKYIQPDDLKVTWNVEEFPEKYYLYRRSDIQAGIYHLGALDYRDKHYPDFEVRYMRFIVADSINYMSPLVFETNESDFEKAMVGFEHKGRKYRGLHSTIEDLKWHKEKGIWNVSREHYQNNGVCSINKKLWVL